MDFEECTSNYITIFRKLWWQSSIYAEYHSQYSTELDSNSNLFDQVEAIIEYIKMGSGKRLVMPDNYPISNASPAAMEIKIESVNKKRK